MTFPDAVSDPGAFLQLAQCLPWAQGKAGHGTADYKETKRIVQERSAVFVNLCWSRWVNRKEFLLPVSDGVVALQEVAKIPGYVLDMQGVLSADAGRRARHRPRSKTGEERRGRQYRAGGARDGGRRVGAPGGI